jgi:hypothetical protein
VLKALYIDTSYFLAHYLTPSLLSQANEVPCTFLMMVDNELRDVATGSIVNPLHRTLHCVQMATDVFRVRLDNVVTGCEDLYPPEQPPEADSELKLGECLSWPLKWPKALIRLDPETVTPAGPTAPPQAAAPTPAVAADDHADPSHVNPGSSSAFIEDDNMEDDLDFLANDGGFDKLSGEKSVEVAKRAKKRLFGSQETPEDAGLPEEPTTRADILTPGTLKAVASQAAKTVIVPEKKPRKRYKKKKPDSSSQIPVPDVVPRIKWHASHWLGRPMLPPDLVEKLKGDLRSLHADVLYREECLLKDPSPGYPLFHAKVPKGFGFVDSFPGDVMLLRFDDLFKMYHLQRLYPTFVRLVSLRMAYDLSREENPHVAIMDPYYMGAWTVDGEPALVTKYVEEFMVANADKSVLLVPYFPE